MAEYKINGKKIELDTNKEYLDFYWQGREANLIQLHLEEILGSIQSGEIAFDDNLKEYMQYLQRWETDAPRKRSLREMSQKGIMVGTSDALFEQDGGEEIIDNLENTGVFAAYFLREVYE